MDLFHVNEGVGGLGILIGWKLVFPGDGSEEEDEEGDTEGGGVSCWNGDRRRGDEDDMVAAGAVDCWELSLI